MTHEMAREKLSPLQKRFVKEYPLDFNGTEAYLRASGTTNRKSAGVQATKLLKLPKVKEALDMYIEEQLGPQEKRLLENVKFWEEVRDAKLPEGAFLPASAVFLALDAFGADEGLVKAMKQIFPVVLPANKTADRMKASEALAKYAQMFVEKHEVETTGHVIISDNIE